MDARAERLAAAQRDVESRVARLEKQLEELQDESPRGEKQRLNILRLIHYYREGGQPPSDPRGFVLLNGDFVDEKDMQYDPNNVLLFELGRVCQYSRQPAANTAVVP